MLPAPEHAGGETGSSSADASSDVGWSAVGWLSSAATGALEEQREALDRQRDELVRARLIRGRCGAMQERARRQLLLSRGKRELYQRVVAGDLEPSFSNKKEAEFAFKPFKPPSVPVELG